MTDNTSYKNLISEDIDNIINGLGEIQTKPEDWDNKYPSINMIKKIYPFFKKLNLIFRYLKYHIFEDHPRIDKDLIDLFELNSKQQIEIDYLKERLKTLTEDQKINSAAISNTGNTMENK